MKFLREKPLTVEIVLVFLGASGGFFFGRDLQANCFVLNRCGASNVTLNSTNSVFVGIVATSFGFEIN